MIITVEGLDGSGKSTAISLMQEKFKEIGLTTSVVSAIGSGEIGFFLRKKIVEENYTSDSMKLLGFPLAILDALRTVEILLKTNNIIIIDRGITSYVVYSNLYSNINNITESVMWSNVNLMLAEFRRISELYKSIIIDVYINTKIDICIERINTRNGNKVYFDSSPKEDFISVKDNFDHWFNVINNPYVFTITNNNNLEDLKTKLDRAIYNMLELASNK